MDLELKPILAGSPDCPAEAVHGSYLHNWSSIKQQGLSRMNRTHIHLAPGLPGEDGVVSGNLLLLVCRTDVGWTNISTFIVFVLVSRHEERLWSCCVCWCPQSTGRYIYSSNCPQLKMLNYLYMCSNVQFMICDSIDGIEFFWSENGVLLTAGNTEGMLLPKYFSRALRLKPTSKQNYCMKTYFAFIFYVVPAFFWALN